MATRHVLLLAVGFALASPAILPAPARAQEEDRTVPEVQNAKHQFIGRLTSGALVRSGPSNNFYATAKLEKGAQVKVVGIKYDWLKIIPPDGSFSLVPQVYVDRRGDGKVGRVNSALNVRAGSTQNEMKSAIQMRLHKGEDVTILDTHDEYYKIVPPKGAYLFVHKQYVAPVGPANLADASGTGDAAEPQNPAPGDRPAELAGDGPRDDAPSDAGDAPEPSTELEQAEAPSPDADTRPSTEVADRATPAPAKPVAANVSQDFRKLEAEFDTASKLSVLEQPIEQLTEGYTNLVKSGGLRASMKRIADARLMALRVRADARKQLREFKETQAQLHQRQQEAAVERQEISERIAQTKVSLFTAVGTLRVSALQQGNTVLYRLIDPGTARTVAYIRTNDPKYAGLLNQFVGVRGELTNDQRQKMKFITPTEAEVVDASKVNSTVIATLVPPSMVMAVTSSSPEEAAAE